MKTPHSICLLFILLSPLVVISDSIDTENQLTPIHYLLRKSQKKKIDQVCVTGPQFDQKGFVKNVSDILVHMDSLNKERELARGVFETTIKSGNSKATSFYVGDNLIMTNAHVVGLNPGEKGNCGRVSISARYFPSAKDELKARHLSNNSNAEDKGYSFEMAKQQEEISCKKILFCGQNSDYCVVEMNNTKSGKSLKQLFDPLELKRNHHQAPVPLTLIGNSSGLGLSAASTNVPFEAKKVMNGDLIHKVPMTGGASGAPIFGSDGKVYALNYGHYGGDFVDKNSTNTAISMDKIYEELKNNRPDILSRMNFK